MRRTAGYLGQGMVEKGWYAVGTDYPSLAVKLIGAAKTTGATDWATEAMWFAKVGEYSNSSFMRSFRLNNLNLTAWNLGLRACQETAVLPALAFRFFGLCSQVCVIVLSLLPGC